MRRSHWLFSSLSAFPFHASQVLWFLGPFTSWIGPLIVTVLAAICGGVAVAPQKPKWALLILWVVALLLYVGSQGWQIGYGLIMIVDHQDETGTCVPAAFEGECRRSSDCAYPTPACYFGSCFKSSPPSRCRDTSDCLSSDFYCARDVADPSQVPSYGGLMLGVAIIFLLSSLVAIIASLAWVCRTGPSPCCRPKYISSLEQ